MELQIEYTNFNRDKSVDELMYIVKLYKFQLNNLESELHFFKFLIKANIYKPHVRNLFEKLTNFDKTIDGFLSDVEDANAMLSNHAKVLTLKMECNDLECDSFFIRKHVKIEIKIFNLITTIGNINREIIQYLKSVIKNI